MTLGKLIGAAVCSVVLLIVIVMGGVPIYKVWAAHQAGMAELAQAEANRQILVQTAQAKKEAATHNKDATIIEAEGIAEANKIIGQSLDENPAYLTYLFYKGLQDTHNDVIYVPTEASIPITEASRFSVVKKREREFSVEAELKGNNVHKDVQSSDKVRE